MVELEALRQSGTGLRLCWRCGYRGRELQGPHGSTTFRCPSCGDDLYARPAMSYLEREGFTELAAITLCTHNAPSDACARVRPRVPSIRFTASALLVSVTSASLLAFGLVMFMH